MTFLEDIVIGERIEIGRHTFAAEDIKSFATRYDPQPFHVDEELAAKSHFGRLCASGWHTAAVCMRLLVEHRRRQEEAARQRGDPVATAGVSPGFRELRWLQPVYAGDTIVFATEGIEKRLLRSRPGWGLLISRNTGTNQAGALVYSCIGSVFVQRRTDAPP